MNEHLTLGALIERLEQHVEEKGEDYLVRCGFGGAGSSRGDYAEVAFEPACNVTVGAMLTAARKAVDARYTGYKGGHFTLGEGTPAWLAAYGELGPAMTDGLVYAMVHGRLWGSVVPTVTELPSSLIALATSFGAALDCEPFAYEVGAILDLVTQWCDANFWKLSVTRELAETWSVKMDAGDEWERITVGGACLSVALMRACVLAVAENVKV